jgi:ATP-dependent Clp protease ATP-binding subunit ClpB
MDFNRMTIKSQEAVAAAQDLARRNGNPEITPDHLLLALLDQDLFRDWQGLRADAERKLAALPSVQGGQQQPSGSATSTSQPSTCSSRSSLCRAARSRRGSRRFAADSV